MSGGDALDLITAITEGCCRPGVDAYYRLPGRGVAASARFFANDEPKGIAAACCERCAPAVLDIIERHDHITEPPTFVVAAARGVGERDADRERP